MCTRVPSIVLYNTMDHGNSRTIYKTKQFGITRRIRAESSLPQRSWSTRRYLHGIAFFSALALAFALAFAFALAAERNRSSEG